MKNVINFLKGEMPESDFEKIVSSEVFKYFKEVKERLGGETKGDTYDSLLKELGSIPQKETIESPILDYMIDRINEIVGEDKYGPKDIRFMVTTIFIKNVDPTIQIVLDSYLTRKEMLDITSALMRLTLYKERLEDDTERLKKRLGLLGALLKSWRSLGTPKYTYQVLEILRDDEDYPGLEDKDITTFQGMFDKFQRPLDIKANTKRWYKEVSEHMKKCPELSDDIFLSELGMAIGEKEKKKIIKKLRKEYEKKSK